MDVAMRLASDNWRSAKEMRVALNHLARNWLVFGSLVAGSLGLMHCSSKDEPSTGDAGGTNAVGGSQGGSVSVAGSVSSVGKAGVSATGGANSNAGAGASNAGKGGGGGGGAVTAECHAEADCGAGQTCMDEKCVVKPCTPPPTAFQFTPSATATSVSLAGSLNAWSPTASPLTFDAGSGAWKGTFPLDPGTYQYKFVVDGATWLPDPKNPDTVDDGFCGFNSQLTIGCEGVEPAAGVHGNGCPSEGGAGAGGASGFGGESAGGDGG